MSVLVTLSYYACVCAAQYLPNCTANSPQPPCRALCTALQNGALCDSGDLLLLAMAPALGSPFLAQTYSNCSALPTTACNDMPASAGLPASSVQLPRCQAINPANLTVAGSPQLIVPGSFLATVLPSSYMVYVPPGQTQHSLVQAAQATLARAQLAIDGLSNDQCRTAFARLVAGSVLPACAPLAGHPTLLAPRLPCQSVCQQLGAPASGCSPDDLTWLQTVYFGGLALTAYCSSNFPAVTAPDSQFSTFLARSFAGQSVFPAVGSDWLPGAQSSCIAAAGSLIAAFLFKCACLYSGLFLCVSTPVIAIFAQPVRASQFSCVLL